MSELHLAPTLSVALKQFKEILRGYAENGGTKNKPLVVFCEDRLSLVAERALCEAVGGTFCITIYTLSRFLTVEGEECKNLLTSQGSAMEIKKLIQKNKPNLQLFKRLSTPTAAQDVYDTLALLYSSKVNLATVDCDDIENALLARKMHDLRLLYTEYKNFLKESNAVDRNVYLKELPNVICKSNKIMGADVLFFGFQALTSSVADCVEAAFETADEVSGLFIGGSCSKYVNEGYNSFLEIAQRHGYRVSGREELPSDLCPAAEAMRQRLFEPDSFSATPTELANDEVRIVCADDLTEECEYIAAEVCKHVMQGGVRYREISVMLPDVNLYQPVLERAFAEYNIPLYVDRRYPLSSNAICSFICDYLACAEGNCLPDAVQAVINSPLFRLADVEEEALQVYKDNFINYLLRAANYRGGVHKPANREICEAEGLDYAGIETLRAAFEQGFGLLREANGKDGAAICDAIQKLMESELFKVEDTLRHLSEKAAEYGYTAVSVMCAHAYEKTFEVLQEAQKLTAGEKYQLKDFIKILKSGFIACEISLIPPKQDAVFVGDLSTCANTGSRVLFVAGLTEGVPACSQDTAILTDGELTSLEKLKMSVSPKISQVNARVKELTALNLCAFSENLHLIYPKMSGGEGCEKSEAIEYVKRIFTCGGNPIEERSVQDIADSEEEFAFFVSYSQPALRSLLLRPEGKYAEAIKEFLSQSGKSLSDLSASERRFGQFNRSQLFSNGISPTALESYYSCPYRAFMQQGLKLNERREGVLRPLDSGNFVHAVLEAVAKNIKDFTNKEQCADFAKKTAEKLIIQTAYAVPEEDGGSGYAAESLIKEVQEYAKGMYDQLDVSSFEVEKTEKSCKIKLDGGVVVGGRIDRVDSSGDLVRIIDYKTGTIDDSSVSYYMGLKVQLPLYLSAAAEGRRAAGAYYFPANLEYSSNGNREFTLKGFMDCSEEVVKSSDSSVEETQRSKFVDAYLNGGKKLDNAMQRQTFADFLSYSKEIASRGAKQLISGSIAPSPVEKACKYCPFGGCCGYDSELSGEREKASASCANIAQIMHNINSEGGEKI